MPELCYSCHTELRNQVKNSANLHGPVEEELCEECHYPHTSKNPRLLPEYLAPNFYAPYNDKNFALCFSCHDDSLAKKAKTTSDTEFRDGNRNLHFLHVNQKKGRTCRACHDPHASNQEHFIRKNASFGRWDLPIKFKATSNGGSCAPSCHRSQSYKR